MVELIWSAVGSEQLKVKWYRYQHVMNKSSQSYGTSLGITVLCATEHKWLKPIITLARQAGIRFTYPRRTEGWVDLDDWLHTEMLYSTTVSGTNAEINISQSGTLLKSDLALSLITIIITERSNWRGSESSTLENDVYVWRYALIVVHVRNERMNEQNVVALYFNALTISIGINIRIIHHTESDGTDRQATHTTY